MSLTQPEVIAGARGVREEREALAAAQAAERPQVSVAIPENEVWYQARYTRYRIQLTAPQDEKLSDGRVRREAPIVAQFSGSMLRLKKDKKKDARTIELLEEHPSKGNLFWNFQDVLEKQAEQERTQVLSVLADPKQRALILEALKAEGADFVLPGKTGKGGEEAPHRK